MPSLFSKYLLSLFFFLSVPFFAHAQVFGISPPDQKIDVLMGTKKSVSVKLFRMTDKEIDRLRVSVGDEIKEYVRTNDVVFEKGNKEKNVEIVIDGTEVIEDKTLSGNISFIPFAQKAEGSDDSLTSVLSGVIEKFDIHFVKDPTPEMLAVDYKKDFQNGDIKIVGLEQKKTDVFLTLKNTSDRYYKNIPVNIQHILNKHKNGSREDLLEEIIAPNETKTFPLRIDQKEDFGQHRVIVSLDGQSAEQTYWIKRGRYYLRKILPKMFVR